MATTAQSQANIQKLLAMGISQAFINAEIAKGEKGAAKGSKVDDKDIQNFVRAWESSGAKADYQRSLALEQNTPDFLKNDPMFQALPLDLREIAVYNYNIQVQNNEDKAKKLAIALESATKMADPYWKNIIRIAQDEVLRGFEQAKGDYQSSIDRQSRRIAELGQDLEYNRNFLSLEQQHELATLKRNYEINKENLIENASQQGLTFSTRRRLAEQRMNEENQGLVESTSRRYNKQIRDLQLEADRGNIEAQKEIENLQRNLKNTRQDLGRTSEKYLGTENLPQLDEYEALGNVPGQLYEDKTRDIAARQQGIYQDLTQGSLDLTV